MNFALIIQTAKKVFDAAKKASPVLLKIAERVPDLLNYTKNVKDGISNLRDEETVTTDMDLSLEIINEDLQKLKQSYLEDTKYLSTLSDQINNITELSKSFSAQIKILFVISSIALLFGISALILFLV